MSEFTADIGDTFTDPDDKYWTVVWKIDGFNGGGGLWVTEFWNWKDGKTCRSQIKTLNLWENARLVQLGSLFKQGPLQ